METMKNIFFLIRQINFHICHTCIQILLKKRNNETIVHLILPLLMNWFINRSFKFNRIDENRLHNGRNVYYLS